jgi:hypothetical protein
MNTAVATAPSAPYERHPRYITPDKLAQHLSRIFDCCITKRTLARWRSRRRGPSWLKFGRSVRYDVRDIERWVTAQRREALEA